MAGFHQKDGGEKGCTNSTTESYFYAEGKRSACKWRDGNWSSPNEGFRKFPAATFLETPSEG